MAKSKKEIKEGSLEPESNIDDAYYYGEERGGAISPGFTRAIVTIAVLLIAAFIIFNITYGRRAVMLISKTEIESLDKESENDDFRIYDRVYFLIGRKYGALDAGLVMIKIEKKSYGNFKKYKNISFEVDADFRKINTYIPGEYFKSPGRYRIKALLDSSTISEREVTFRE